MLKVKTKRRATNFKLSNVAIIEGGGEKSVQVIMIPLKK